MQAIQDRAVSEDPHGVRQRVVSSSGRSPRTVPPNAVVVTGAAPHNVHFFG